jgi:broad specificity phosphatase PhoE
MGVIYVVRHGQAAFGTEHYDRLTEIGFNQARLLGAHFSRRKVKFDAVYTGTLRRQIETADAILESHPELDPSAREIIPGLDEYKPEAILTAFMGKPFETSASAGAARRDPLVIREHFRLLREALIAWAEDRTQPQDMMPFGQFQEAAVGALVQARQRHPDGHVLVVSSGGAIGAMVSQVLNAPPATAVELNLRIRNSSLTEFASTPRRHHLVSFNGLTHLEVAEPSLITYA